MTADEVVEYVESELGGTIVVVASEEGGAPEVAWGDTFFFYDPDGITSPDNRLPYATIVVNDYPGFDEASDLQRPGVFRVNAWVSKETFAQETDPADEAGIDYALLDEVIPHPVYGKQSWVSVLSPGPATETKTRELLAEAHRRAKARYEKKTA